MDALDKFLDEVQKKMDKSVQVLAAELKVIRAARASTAMLDNVMVEAYGSRVPLNQVAALAAPDASMLTVKPYDRSVIGDIERSLMKADLGLTPSNDGQLIRLPIPPLSEERRKALIKKVSELVEQSKTVLRNIRRDANEAVKAMEKDKKISEDQRKASLDEIQELLNKHTNAMDDLRKAKEKDILEK
jgi:ribosome recycling factor